MAFGGRIRILWTLFLVHDAFVKKEHCVAIFFYLEKAYDTTWKYGIMKDLHDIGLRGRLRNFISNFLSDRSFNVRKGSTFSDTFEQEQGVPQGSILSPTLFNIKINNIVKCVNDTDSSLYVNDFGIFYKSNNMLNVLMIPTLLCMLMILVSFINRTIWRIYNLDFKDV